jgi:glycosyltransferase involved in cell wall biosynthesis
LHASLIVTTYNQPRFLGMVLAALCRQSRTDFEVIVADDGSGQETFDLIERVRAGAPFPLKHFWQKNAGFRAGQARNGAALLAAADWLLFLDGDMLVHPRFVEAHLDAAGRDRVLFGGRVKLTEEFSARLAPAEIAEVGIERIFAREFATCREAAYTPAPEGRLDDLTGRLIQRFGGRRAPFADRGLNAAGALLPRAVLFRLCFKSGSNFSTGRRLFEAVNGFDHRYNLLSGEDGDLFRRLLHAGAAPRTVLRSAVAFHLWHRDNWQRQGELRDRVKAMERAMRAARRTACEDGLRQVPDARPAGPTVPAA